MYQNVRKSSAPPARMAAALAVAVLFLGLSPGPLQAPPQALADLDFAAVEKAALDLGASYGTDRVLLVFDMDNTLLRMNQDLGCDEWYKWQSGLAAGDPDKIIALAEAQGLLYDLSSMHPPEGADESRIVKRLQDRGFAAIVLTGRNPAYRSATERELARNGFDFSQSAVPPREGFGGTFDPYDLKNTEAAGFILPCDRKLGTFPPPRAVSYQCGVMMAYGQDKGLMLRALLARGGRQYAAIMFVDDSPTNLENVSRAFVDCTSIKVVPIIYSRGGSPFDATAAAAAWRKLGSTLVELFGREIK